MKKILLTSFLLSAQLLQAVNDNAPTLHLVDVLHILCVILLIILVKAIIIKYFSKFSWYTALKTSTWLNICALVIGYVPLGFVALFVWRSVVAYVSANCGNISGAFMFLPVVVLISCLIEIPIFRALYPQVDRKQSFRWLFIANILTGLIYITASILL